MCVNMKYIEGHDVPLGQYAGGTGTLPMRRDMVIVALFSGVIYFWAVSTRQ